MNADILFFFDGKGDALFLYEKLEGEILARIPNAGIKVSKTQISFSNHRGFAMVSFLPVKKAKDRPDTWITVSFGLGYHLESPRIHGASEPYPNRWTHHVMIGSADEIDDEFMAWIEEAAAFSASKR